MEEQVNNKPIQNSKHFIWKIIITACIILIISGSIFGWIAFNKSKTAGEQWVEYVSPKQDYKLEHPQSWVEGSLSPIYVTLNSPENERIKQGIKAEDKRNSGYMDDITIAYYESGDNFAGYPTFKNWLDTNQNNPDGYISNVNKINFAESEAYEMIMSGSRDGYVIMLEHNNHLYQIGFNSRAKKSELTDIDKRIISSFEFID